MRRHLLAITLSILLLPLVAQELYDEEAASLFEVDPTLFNLYTPTSDPYSEATKYYRPPLSQRRRGIDWQLAQLLLRPYAPPTEGLEVADPTTRLRLYSSTKGYNIGVAAEYASRLRSGWNIEGEVRFESGHDLSVEGVFAQDVRTTVGVSRLFAPAHYLTLSINAPILTHGLHSNASQEAITLTGDYLYNPSWGLYDGEVRNSRVMKYAIPELTARYQRPINRTTTLVATLSSEAGRRSYSRLGWYDAYNPTPDYYRKLPSYISSTAAKLDVEQLWRDNDTAYTQIAWDDLVRYNQLSVDGSAHYLLEDRVVQCRAAEFAPSLVTHMGRYVDLNFGATLSIRNLRSFKEVADLLGADYHIDHDLYVGDNVNLGNDMQNDLRNPDRRVVVGERFGYDYRTLQRSWAFNIGVEYRHRSLAVLFDGVFGEQQLQRRGYYEKERFPSSLSYGDSRSVKLPSNSATIRLNYTISNRHRLALRASYTQRPNDPDDTFVQIESANRVIDTPSSRTVSSINLAYQHSTERLSLDIEAYVIYSRGETQIWSSYDDLSYTYANNVISDLSQRSAGVEVVATYKIGDTLEWSTSLSLGDYTYDKAPTVTLYDDSDMSPLYSTPATAIKGCKVGNAPQILATSSLSYRAGYKWFATLNLSCGAGRYIAPSFTRRTDRIVMAASYSPQLVSSIVAQESIPALFDATLSATRMIYLRNNRRISATLRINNLLGERDRIDYARESNRLLTTAAGASVGSQYCEANYYRYSAPRSLYLACSYRF